MDPVGDKKTVEPGSEAQASRGPTAPGDDPPSPLSLLPRVALVSFLGLCWIAAKDGATAFAQACFICANVWAAALWLAFEGRSR